MPKDITTTTPIDVALQGGGAHGAFTWGVLDRLFQDETLRIGALSGASAGAMNAVVAASGFMRGGHNAAREDLRIFWTAVNKAARRTAPFLPIFDPVSAWLRASSRWLDTLSAGRTTFSASPLAGLPAQDMLRRILTEVIDFDALRRPEAPRLFIAATHVLTGLARIFTNEEITPEVLLASACLPTVFPPVTIEGEDYWDGGFSANPPIMPLIENTETRDLILVTINPYRRLGTPRLATDIPDRISELTFNQSLLSELRAIAMLKEEFQDDPTACRIGIVRAVARLRFHEINNEEAMGEYDPVSKLFPSWGLLTELHGIGERTTDHWLKAHRTTLGTRSTAQLIERFG
ncbi:patatin-like phospholipase family protein [Maritimibacter sp. DP1N21-5]|uniref:patatin-like phospholipase family protein n=1 Tax=Maritimibacter sp. DP1N21-5 TaxID=2836867 RepID=UPI001C486A2C|nr:patatin-like phospholipase family protein [Maritimibacter sp. DP1N21-5]MBV7407742.1 patatin-like phospholipase family protein [Maritimibacter sp. DP1N21-5]